MQCVYPRGQTSKYISRCYINTQYINIRKYIRLSHYLHVICKLTFLGFFAWLSQIHYNDVIMGAMASQITSLTMACSAVYSMRRSKKTLKPRDTGLCVCGLVNSPHKGPVTRLCAGKSPVTGEFLAQGTSNAENVLMTSSCSTCPAVYAIFQSKIGCNMIYVIPWWNECFAGINHECGLIKSTHWEMLAIIFL